MAIGSRDYPLCESSKARSRLSGLFFVIVSTIIKKKESRFTDLAEEPSNRPGEWKVARFEPTDGRARPSVYWTTLRVG